MYTFSLTEEIARWAFEIHFPDDSDWKIAFTNPTAGPWKTIKATNPSSGKIGEVYRFELEETRPDIVLFNDTLEIIIIVEAKDTLTKLLSSSQIKKNIEVVDQLSRLLSGQSHNEFWGRRAKYSVITGLLWGEETPCNPKYYNALFDAHFEEMRKRKSMFRDFIIGVKTKRNQESLQCEIVAKCYCTSAESRVFAVAQSMGLTARILT